MTALLATIAAVLGLAVGSFLNVVAHRVPEGLSVVRPPSACPSCGHGIRPYDNVPVVSWLFLRGRCRDCAAPISVRYPLVEAGTAAIFVATVWVVGESWTLPAYWCWAALGVVLTMTDLDHQRIPNRILLPGTVLAALLLAGGAVADGEPAALLRAAAGGGAYFGGLLALALLARGGFGFGDVKLGFLLGVFLAYRSWRVLAVGVFAAFVVGGLIAAGLLVARRAGRRDAIPFGPSMVGGAWIALAWGESIASWYLG